MPYYYGFDWTYIVLVLPCVILSLWASANVNSTFKRYSQQYSRRGLTGAQAAAQVLSANGVSGVRIERISGSLTDHFDPRTNVIRLSDDVYGSTSTAAIGVACHEAGHACQYAEDYTPMKIRGSLVPVASLASNAWIFLLLAGMFLQASGLVTAAIIMYACVVLFELVTLPVEFNASNRAKAYMQPAGYQGADISGSSAVLRSCAMTYVAAALTSILQLLWLVSQNRD